jgi:hypothetical protein
MTHRHAGPVCGSQSLRIATAVVFSQLCEGLALNRAAFNADLLHNTRGYDALFAVLTGRWA